MAKTDITVCIVLPLASTVIKSEIASHVKKLLSACTEDERKSAKIA